MNKNHKCYFHIATFLMALGICAVACSPKTKDESSESKSFIGWLRGAKDLDKFRIANQGKYFEGKTIVDGKPDSELKTCVIAVYENGLEIRNAKDLPSAYNRESHGSFSFASYSYYGMRGVGGGRIENSRDRCINFERKCYDYIAFDEDFALKAFGDMNVVENNECEVIREIPAEEMKVYIPPLPDISTAQPIPQEKLIDSCINRLRLNSLAALSIASEVALPIKEEFHNYRGLTFPDGSLLYVVDLRYTAYASDDEGKVVTFGGTMKPNTSTGKCDYVGAGFKHLKGPLGY